MLKKKKSKGQATVTLQAVPKNYDEMTWEEKRVWATEFLSGMKPDNQKDS